jgi:hypothetical protein
MDFRCQYTDPVKSPVIAVRVRDDAHARIAWATASHPDIGRVTMLGRKPPRSWSDLVVAAGVMPTPDIVLDPEPGDPGIVVTSAGSTRPGIIHASPEGLARALRVRLGEADADVVWTTRGKPHRTGTVFHFPPPLGPIRGTTGDTPIDSELAGSGAFGTKILVVVDDRAFLEAICMAAGGVIADTDLTRPTPVWDRADRYLTACEELGLVIAEAVSS